VSPEGVLVLVERPPPDILATLLALAHDDPLAGHGGVARSLAFLSAAASWPGLRADVERFVSLCPTCQKLRSLPPSVPSLASTRASGPLESVFIDHFGPLPEAQGFSYILVCVDRFSRFVVLVPVPSTSTADTVAALHGAWFCRFGPPRLITTDGASSFTSAAFTAAATSLGFAHHVSAPLHPEGHGPVERVNRDIGQILRALLIDASRARVRPSVEWPSLVAPTAFALNAAPSRSLGTSPFQVLHGFPPRLPVHAALDASVYLPSDADDPLAFSQHLISASAEIFERVRQQQESLYQESLRAARAHAKGQVDFEPGTYVLVFFPRERKLDLQWRGPYLVIDRDPVGPYVYQCQSLVDSSVSRIHANRLHVFWPGDLSPEELRAEAARLDEFFVEAVYEHRVDDDGMLRFRVKWLGYDYDEADAWVSHPNCRHAPAIQAYMREHAVRPPRATRR
jgi:transposase InsO family protein